MVAGELPQRVVHLRHIVTAELRAVVAAGLFDLLGGQQRRADRADNAVVRRYDYLFAGDGCECGGDRVVVRRSALEEYPLADPPPSDDAVDVVVNHRRRQCGDQVGLLGAALHVAVDVAFHEHGAPLAETDRGGARQRQFGELVLDCDVEFFGAFLQEAARARGAGLVHREIDDHAVLQRDVLGVLPADLENGVGHLPVEHGLTNKEGAGFVCGDFVVYGVGSDKFADKLPSGPRCPDAANVQALAPLGFDFRERRGDNFNRSAHRFGVYFGDHLSGIVDDYNVRRDASDVDSDVGVDGLPVVVAYVLSGAVAQQQHVFHRQRRGGGKVAAGGVAGVAKVRQGG